jgi:uncharacterized membrane protein YphA (DoxX/SURF4 family)
MKVMLLAYRSQIMHLALLLCRLLVGAAFIAYGLVKLLGGQFYHGDFVLDSRTTEGTWLVWCFFGYSSLYARFLGLCELVPGVLVLLPRTSTFGSLALLAVSLNITVMDFCFDFPSVKYTALLLTVLCGVLVASDYRRLKLIFWDNPSPEWLDRVQRERWEADLAEPKAKARAGGRGKRALAVVLSICAAAPFLNLLAVAITPGPEEVAVAHCAIAGWDPSQLQVRRWRRTEGDWGINMKGYVELECRRGDKPALLRVQVRRPNGFLAWRAVQIESEP